MLRPFVLAVSLLLVAAGCSGSGDDDAAVPLPTGDPVADPGVVVGVVMAETGRWAETEAPLIAALRAEADRRNEAGGAAGEQIDLRVRDSESTIEGATAGARALFDIGARLLFVGCDADVAAGAAVIGQESSLVVVSPCASSSTFTAEDLGDLVFTFGTDNMVQGVALAEYAFEQRARRVALVSEVVAPDSTEVCGAFDRQHVELGGSVAADIVLGEGGTSVERLGETLATFENLDGVIACVLPPTLGEVLDQIEGMAPIVMAPMAASAGGPLPGVDLLAPATGIWADLATSAAEAAFDAVDEAEGYSSDEVADAIEVLDAAALAVGPTTMGEDHVALPSGFTIIGGDGSVVERPVPVPSGQ